MKQDEYKELFFDEAQSSLTDINKALTQLEKSPADKSTINQIFRITHTLKGNARGMGYDKVAELAHVMEDFFAEVREGKIQMTQEVFASVFKAADVLGELVSAIQKPKEVRYRGIKTKLEVLIANAKNNATGEDGGLHDDVDQNEEEVDNTNENSTVVFSDLVQVPVRKLDNLLNLVGELVIERDRLLSVLGNIHGANQFSRLSRISSDLQYSVMDVRLVQVSFLFDKFHRVVRDAAVQVGKDVQLKIEGAETEIDRNILHVISDSLIHIIRNAVGHGIEKSSIRLEAGKPSVGTIVLKARSDSNNVLIEIIDDGAGIDLNKVKTKAINKGMITELEASQLSSQDIIRLIFEPGFSTVDEVNAISGRGVGMDVVKKAVDSIGGTIDLNTMPGQGTRIILNLPSSMAVKSTLLFELDNETYAMPLSFTESVVSIYKTDIHKTGAGLVALYQDRTFPVLFLSDLFNQPQRGEKMLHHTFDKLHPEEKLEVVIISVNEKKLGIVTHKLLQQKEIVEKPLRKPVDQVKIISGTTILGNGSVCMVLNVPALLLAWSNMMSGKNPIIV